MNLDELLHSLDGDGLIITDEKLLTAKINALRLDRERSGILPVARDTLAMVQSLIESIQALLFLIQGHQIPNNIYRSPDIEKALRLLKRVTFFPGPWVDANDQYNTERIGADS